MVDAFDGQPDPRQGPAEQPVTRFRPRFRALTQPELVLHDAIKTKADELCALIEQVKPGRYRSLAITDLESSIMWAIKELTGPPPK